MRYLLRAGGVEADSEGSVDGEGGGAGVITAHLKTPAPESIQVFPFRQHTEPPIPQLFPTRSHCVGAGNKAGAAEGTSLSLCLERITKPS